MFYKLPEELIWIILEFSGMDKKSNMDKVLDQFIKGGFNRKNLKIQSYLHKQHLYAKKFWLSTRHELLGLRAWNPVTLNIETCPFEYMDGEWSIKWNMVRVTFIKNIWVNGKIVKRFRQHQSAKNPVSKWLQNIERFETAHPALATYLPERKNRFNIKFNSKFYKDRSKKRKKKIARTLKFQQNKKKSQDLLTDVSNIKLESVKKQYGFEIGQEVLIPCLHEQTLGPFQSGSMWCNPLSGPCLQEGKITRIGIWQKKTYEGREFGKDPVPHYRHGRWPPGKYYNKLCKKSIENAFQVQITIMTPCDEEYLKNGERFFAHYTPDVLFERLQESDRFLKK